MTKAKNHPGYPKSITNGERKPYQPNPKDELVLIDHISKAESDVVNERRRQMRTAAEGAVKRGSIFDGEGWTAKWDDDVNDDRELAQAAACYAFGAAYSDYARKSQTQQDHANRPTRIYDMWPMSWDWEWYKPTTARRDLVKAAALCIAEIERLDRLHQRTFDEAEEQYISEKALEAEYGSSTAL